MEQGLKGRWFVSSRNVTIKSEDRAQIVWKEGGIGCQQLDKFQSP